MPGFTPPAPPAHTMLAEAIPIIEPTWEVLQVWNSPLVGCPKNVRTTIWTKTITVPEGKTEVFITAYIDHSPTSPVVTRTAYIVIDGVTIASRTRDEVYWMGVAGWTTLTSGTHSLAIDMLFPTATGYSAQLVTEKACVMCCRVPGSKYVSFSDTDVRNVFSRAKKVKVIVGAKGLSYGDGPPYAYCYVKATDKFGNVDEVQIIGEWTVNPILHEFAFLDTVNVELRSGDYFTGSWISYLNVIYEL